MPRHGAGSLRITQAVLDAYGPTCHLQGSTCTRIATTRDHLIPHSLGGPDELHNLRPACKTCNSRRGNRVLSGYGATITVVIGPPTAGKSTYVRDRAQLGDVVIDLDRIARALMPEAVETPSHTYPDHVRHVAIGARKAAIDRATRLVNGAHVWLIHANPAPADLDLYRFLRYELVVLDPGRDVVQARVEAERPGYTRAYVASWYARHGRLAAAPAPTPTPTPTTTPDPDADW